METPARILAKLKPNLRRPKDHTALWSYAARRRHRYNRMDPDPEPESDVTPPASRPIIKDRDGKFKVILSKEDWRKFWVERLRKIVDAPHLTDKDLADAVERSRRIFLRQREENRKPHIDPDIPSCYYWDKFQVADWIESVGLPQAVKEMFLSFDISGRHLITLDANKLLKMGLYELGTIKAVTKAVRDVLGLPHTNGFRAMARVPALERFLNMKVRTGPQSEKFTFKEFCEKERVEYEPVKKQMTDRYQPIPGCCRVEIQPDPNAEVKWIPVKVHKKPKITSIGEDNFDYQLSDSSLSSTSSDSLLDNIPTVEELAKNVLMRNTFIPKILNDIVEGVYAKVAEHKKNRRECRIRHKQQVANEVVKDQLDKVYSDFRISDPEDKLKFVTIIAEELVEDVMRAREILEDMDSFQKRIKSEIAEEDMQNLQVAVAHYVQNIMPVVVSAALKAMEESSSDLNCELERDISRFNDSESDDDESQNELEAEPEQPIEEHHHGEEFEVIWDRTFNEDHKPFFQ